MEKNVSRPAKQLLLIGGSAGSLEVILAVLPNLKVNPAMAIIIILHRKGGDDSNTLLTLLKERSATPVKEVEEKELITGGYIYIAPGDYHLLVEKDKTLSLDYSEKVHFSRPSIDVGFQTAAEAYGPNAIGLLLSGASKDGTDGLRAINKAGGVSVIQAPGSSVVDFMPAHALQHAAPAKVLNVAEITAYINQL
jgi:two-component system, chemotaxis family, protein-glutamate methylesterase/glutaminase